MGFNNLILMSLGGYENHLINLAPSIKILQNTAMTTLTIWYSGLVNARNAFLQDPYQITTEGYKKRDFLHEFEDLGTCVNEFFIGTITGGIKYGTGFFIYEVASKYLL